jgi:hypothetical protein
MAHWKIGAKAGLRRQKHAQQTLQERSPAKVMPTKRPALRLTQNSADQAREINMSTSRLLSVLATVGLIVVMVVAVGTAATANLSNSALDQHERHPASVNSSALSAAVAEQARLEYRRGEWNASHSNYAAVLDQHERHITVASSADQARLDYRRGEWNAGNSADAAKFDVEQTRIGWRAGK